MANNLDVTRKTIANKLKQFRIAKGLKGKEVAAQLGVSPKTVSAWECARAQPDADTLMLLCKLYEVDNISVFYGTPDGISDEREQVLLDAFRRLNAEGQEAVINCATGLDLSGAYKKSNQVGMDQEEEDLMDEEIG